MIETNLETTRLLAQDTGYSAAETASAIESGFANLVAGTACGLSMFGFLGMIIAVIALIRTFKLKSEINELRSRLE